MLCLLLLVAGLQAAPQLAADDGAARRVVVTDSEGKTRSGLLTELAAGQLTLGAGEHVRLKTKSLVSLKFKERTSAIAAADPLVILAGGDILAVRPEAIDDESLTALWVRFPAWPALKVPVEAVRSAILSRPSAAAPGARLFNQIFDFRDSHDAIVLTNGDALAGEFAGLDEKHLFLQEPQGKSAVARSGIRAVIFNPSLTNGEALKSEGALVSLVDGSRFRARDLKLEAAERLSMSAVFGARLEIPLSAVESLRFLGGCATYLSDLAPAEYVFEPFLDLPWPLRRDRTVSGGFLTLRGVECAKGLGVHSRSSVTYRLDGKYRLFRAALGIDDDTLGKGSAVFEVILDGQRVFKSDVLTGTSAAVAIERLDISGAKLLILRVDFATFGDIQDHADWCEAVLIK